MNNNWWLAFSIQILYIIALALNWLSIKKRNSKYEQQGIFILIISFILHTLWLIKEILNINQIPLASLHSAVFMWAWCTLAVGFIIRLGLGLRQIYSFLLPIVCSLLTFALIVPNRNFDLSEISWFFLLHIIISFISYGFFTTALATGIMYLVQERQLKKHLLSPLLAELPAVEELDKINYWLISGGLVLLTVTIATGIIWAKKNWGQYWGWDIKETSVLIIWILYVILFHIRSRNTVRGHKIALFSVIFTLVIIVSFLGIIYMFPSSLHTLK